MNTRHIRTNTSGMPFQWLTEDEADDLSCADHVSHAFTDSAPVHGEDWLGLIHAREIYPEGTDATDSYLDGDPSADRMLTAPRHYAWRADEHGHPTGTLVRA